ncbi:MAG: histidine phosphatase family protein [Patescibacteria group bacterium]
MKEGGTTTIYLLRHAQTEHNEKQIFQGHFDGKGTHVTEQGKRDLEGYLKRFEKVSFSAIFCSDLTRSRQTAEIFSKKFGLPVLATPLLRGKRMGHYEGTFVSDYRIKNKEVLGKMHTLSEQEQWDHKMSKEMESNAEVLRRLMIFLRNATATYPGKNILAITHGGVIRNLLFYLTWAKQHEMRAGSVNNGGYVKLIFDGTTFKAEELFGIAKN